MNASEHELIGPLPAILHGHSANRQIGIRNKSLACVSLWCQLIEINGASPQQPATSRFIDSCAMLTIVGTSPLEMRSRVTIVGATG